MMDCRTTLAHRFRARVRFKTYDVILPKENSVLTRIIYSFGREHMQTQYNNVLGYRIDLYFDDYKLAIEIGENRHSDRNIDFEIKNQKAMEQKLGFKFNNESYQWNI